MSLNLQPSESSWQAYALHLLKNTFNLTTSVVESKDDTSLTIAGNLKLNKLSSIIKNLKFSAQNNKNFSVINQYEVSHWINLMEKVFQNQEASAWIIENIEKELELKTVIVGQELSAADVAVFAALSCLKGFTVMGFPFSIFLFLFFQISI